MKNQMWLTGLLAAILILSSCSTVPPAQREDRIADLLVELQNSDIDRLMEISARPFLLDGEILMRESDIRTLWTNLAGAGFRFDQAAILSIEAVDADSYLDVADTMDVRVFFDSYLPENAGVVAIETMYGSFLILTGGKVGRIPQLAGFTGPR